MRLLRVQYGVLFPLILFIALIGAWVINGSAVALLLMLGFGVLEYLMHKSGYEPAPMVLAYVMAPIFENALRQSLILWAGSLSIFVTRPISAAFLIVAAGLLISAVLPSARSARSILVAHSSPTRSPLR